MKRWTAAVVLAAACAVPAGASHTVDVPCRTPGTLVSRTDGWTEFVAPNFPRGPSVIEQFAATPDGELWAGNGAALVASTDGACTWREVLVPAPADPPTLYGEPRVSAFALGLGRVVVALEDPLAVPPPAPTTPAPPRILTTDDDGATWQTGGTGLPPGSRVVGLAVGPERLAALLVDAPAAVYLSADSGATWQPQRGAAPGAVAELAWAGDSLWAWGDAGLFRSSDAGDTFALVGELPAPVRGFAARGGREFVAATRLGLARSTDAGTTWRVGSEAPGSDAVALGARSGALLAASAQAAVYVAPGTTAPQRVTPYGGERIHAAAIDDRRHPVLYAVARGGVFRAEPGPDLGTVKRLPPPDLPKLPPLALRPGEAMKIRHPALRPATSVHRLLPGERRRVRYTVDLPPTPTPLDVFFLVDTTNSFQPLINALRQQLAEIVNSLTASRIDAHFGVAEFRDYPTTAQSDPTNFAYRRLRAVGPVDDQLTLALQRLRAEGGTTDGRTSALAALYQAATGAGQHVATGTVTDPYAIPPGQDAKFRPGALRVVLLVTDTEPRPAQPGYPGPSLDRVATALAERGVLQVGLVVGSPPEGIPGPYQALAELARRSGALAVSPLDCDDDAVVDVPAGGPLVCHLGAAGLDDAILSLLRGVRDEAAVELSLEGDPRIVQPASALVVDGVNIKQASRLAFDVDFVCPVNVARATHAVALAVRSRGGVLLRGEATVECLPAPVPPAPGIEPPRPVAVAAVAPAAPAVPANPAPHPNPNPNPNPQANPNPQGALGVQEDEQPQLAVAGTALPQDDDNTVPYTVGTFAMTAAAAAYAVRTRHRTAPSAQLSDAAPRVRRSDARRRCHNQA